MKINLLLPVALVALMAATSTAAFAAVDGQPLSFIGVAAPAQAPADQLVVVTGKTCYVNVTGGSTVRFTVDGTSFSWTFDNPGQVTPFDLQRIAPKGLLHRPVEVYVSANPLYQS